MVLAGDGVRFHAQLLCQHMGDADRPEAQSLELDWRVDRLLEPHALRPVGAAGQRVDLELEAIPVEGVQLALPPGLEPGEEPRLRKPQRHGARVDMER